MAVVLIAALEVSAVSLRNLLSSLWSWLRCSWFGRLLHSTDSKACLTTTSHLKSDYLIESMLLSGHWLEYVHKLKLLVLLVVHSLLLLLSCHFYLILLVLLYNWTKEVTLNCSKMVSRARMLLDLPPPSFSFSRSCFLKDDSASTAEPWLKTMYYTDVDLPLRENIGVPCPHFCISVVSTIIFPSLILTNSYYN